MRQTIRTIGWAVALVIGAALLAAGPASAWSPQAKSKQKQKKAQPQQTDQQQPSDQQQADQPPPPPPPSGALTQKVTLRSSRQTKDVASAGFNGVGPDGKIKEALLKANPSSAAKAKAAQLSLVEADAADVQAFATEGKLNLPAKSADKKGK
jgi:hypothetical protein